MDIVERIRDATAKRGPDFSAYTERDGEAWYIIAGHRDSWHGAGRVADTPYYGSAGRAKAQAALLFLMGEGAGFTIADAGRRLAFELIDGNGNAVTVWRADALRAFPELAARLESVK